MAITLGPLFITRNEATIPYHTCAIDVSHVHGRSINCAVCLKVVFDPKIGRIKPLLRSRKELRRVRSMQSLSRLTARLIMF